MNTKDIVLIGLLAALLKSSQVILSFLPNIEIVSLLILIFKFTFFSSKNSNTNFILNILSYLLLLSLFVHYFI